MAVSTWERDHRVLEAIAEGDRYHLLPVTGAQLANRLHVADDEIPASVKRLLGEGYIEAESAWQEAADGAIVVGDVLITAITEKGMAEIGHQQRADLGVADCLALLRGREADARPEYKHLWRRVGSAVAEGGDEFLGELTAVLLKANPPSSAPPRPADPAPVQRRAGVTYIDVRDNVTAAL